jgi:hypothetical protein
MQKSAWIYLPTAALSAVGIEVLDEAVGDGLDLLLDPPDIVLG